MNRIIARDKSGKMTPKNLHRRRKSKEKSHKSKRASMPVSMSPPMVSHIRRQSMDPNLTHSPKLRSPRSVQSVNSEIFALHRSTEVHHSLTFQFPVIDFLPFALSLSFHSQSVSSRPNDAETSSSPLRHSTPEETT